MEKQKMKEHYLSTPTPKWTKIIKWLRMLHKRRTQIF
jgi:hypothetical protein